MPLVWFGFITGSCETIPLKIQVHMHIVSVLWLTTWTADLTACWDSSTCGWKMKEPSQMMPSSLWHCSSVLFLDSRSLGPPAIHLVLGSAIQLIFRNVQFWTISFPNSAGKSFRNIFQKHLKGNLFWPKKKDVFGKKLYFCHHSQKGCSKFLYCAQICSKIVGH